MTHQKKPRKAVAQRAEWTRQYLKAKKYKWKDFSSRSCILNVEMSNGLITDNDIFSSSAGGSIEREGEASQEKIS